VSDRKPAPQLGGATEAFMHERASATPATAPSRETKSDAHARAPEAPRDSSLRAIEEWFVAAITAPHASDALDADATRLLTRGPKLAAADRLAIYRYGYRARLVECLADDYPALQFALGQDAFEALCLAYIERHPSSAPSLNFYGRHMPHFIRDEAEPFPLRDFAADLASLEWALVEVLHARVADRLSQEELAAIPIEKWVDARLPGADAVRVLRFQYPVNAFFQAFKTDREPSAGDFGRNLSATAVYRTDMTLWRMDLTPAMTTLLESLFAGRPLGAALETLEDGLTAEDAAEAERNVMAWFREWVAAGFFAGVEVG
jgi:hypothetical protein